MALFGTFWHLLALFGTRFWKARGFAQRGQGGGVFNFKFLVGVGRAKIAKEAKINRNPFLTTKLTAEVRHKMVSPNINFHLRELWSPITRNKTDFKELKGDYIRGPRLASKMMYL